MIAKRQDLDDSLKKGIGFNSAVTDGDFFRIDAKGEAE